MSELKKLATNLRKIDAETKKAVMYDRKCYQALGREVTKKLKENIAKETANLTWGEGKQVDNEGKVSFRTIPNASSVKIMWTGPYVDYIEYGAGIVGAQSNMHYETDDYAPQAEGHKFGEYWVFKQENQWYFSWGWEPKAPFYKTMFAMRMGGKRELRLTDYEKALHDAVRKGLDKALRGGT